MAAGTYLERANLSRRHTARVDAAVRPHHFHHDVLHTSQRNRIRQRCVELDIAALLAEMKRSRLPAMLRLSHRSDQVLCGVLLHVIKSARPVQGQLRRPRLYRTINIVANVAANPLHIDYRHVVDEAMIGRLAATLRVQNRVVENHERTSLLTACRDNLDMKLGEVGLALVGLLVMHRGYGSSNSGWATLAESRASPPGATNEFLWEAQAQNIATARDQRKRTLFRDVRPRKLPWNPGATKEILDVTSDHPVYRPVG